MKFLRTIPPFFLLLCALFLIPPLARAVEPFAPFSKDGNPDEKYIMEKFFPLFRYIRPAALKVYENRDRSRNYQDLEVCADGDRRDKICSVDLATGKIVDECEGGEVDVCFKGGKGGGVAYTAHSDSGSCKVGSGIRYGGGTGIVQGHCEYKQRPSISGELKATDFSAENRSLGTSSTPTDPTTTTATPPVDVSGLTYPKLQNEALIYGNVGTDNPISWGSHYLGLNQCDRAIKQAMVVERAKQTKNTVATTGEWPLGWVDWGYKTKNGTTLLEISDELPGSVSGPTKVIIEATDDFFLNAGNLDAVSESRPQKKQVCDAVTDALSKPNPDKWVVDLSQSPIYSPSFRQGYARGSICVWNLCCPGLFCPWPDELFGNSKGLYADISVSQAFGAALDDLLLWHPLEDGVRLFNKMAVTNPLIRFAGAAGPEAIPSKIHSRLSQEIKDECLKYVPGPDDFTLGRFGFIMDYADPPTFLGPNKTCPGWAIQPELTKEQGGAFPQTLLSKLINLIWGHQEDEVDPIKKHLITIPDAMGQSLSEIQDPVEQIRDTLENNKVRNEYTKTLSNIVDATSEFLYAGKGIPVGNAKQRLTYFTCTDPNYSAPQATGIQAYALGTRIGCYQSPAPGGKCDPALFAALLEKNGGIPTTASTKADQYFDSSIASKLTPELMNIYGAASAATGVPCEILAGIHFVEADNDPQGSLVSGRKIGTPEPDAGGKVFKDLLETAVYAGNHLKGKVGGNLKDVPTAITALSRYNGGGNSNCQLGYPYPIPYGGCPRKFEGEDDPYPVNFLDARHGTMYLLYCADHTACAPAVFQRPGSFTVALEVYNKITKDGNIPTGTSAPTASPTPVATPVTGGGALQVNPSGKCGSGFIDTGLGCLPFSRDAFVSALLGFLAGVSGLISLVVMMFSTFQIMTAAGNPEQLKKGKELFTAGVTGLLFIVFAVTFLRIIAGDIIKLPGF